MWRIWSREGAYNQTELAADLGPRILRFYEEYFNTSFPLPKQDMIAIPGSVVQDILSYACRNQEWRYLKSIKILLPEERESYEELNVEIVFLSEFTTGSV